MSITKEFLHNARRSISPYSIFVVGNEAADCDSIASSIAYAYLSKNPNYIPLVNNKKDVISLRSEVNLALSFAGVSVDDLLYFEDVYKKFEHFKFFLVDHNEPSAKWTRLGLKYEVVGILDHHADGGLFLSALPRTIKTCASTTSLIINTFDDIDFQLREMLLTALTFDTVNWTWRVTDFDVRMGVKLLNDPLITTQEHLHERCTSIIAEIETNVIHEDSVDPLMLMQKDYKLYQKNDIFYGISVIHIDFKSIPNLEEVMRETMRSDGLDVHIILSAVRPPGQYSFYQQFAICCSNANTFAMMTLFLIPDIKLEPIHDICSNSSFQAFNQLCLETSRKRLQPLVHSLLENH